MATLEESISPELPNQGRLLGIDYGSVRIGLALCDPDQIIASPWAIYTRSTPTNDNTYFQQLVFSERIAGIVFGLPLHMSGDESGKAAEVRQFAQALETFLKLPVAFHDERFSSALAQEYLSLSGLKGKNAKLKLDKIAAQIILQSYLDLRRQTSASLERPTSNSD